MSAGRGLSVPGYNAIAVDIDRTHCGKEKLDSDSYQRHIGMGYTLEVVAEYQQVLLCGAVEDATLARRACHPWAGATGTRVKGIQ